MRRQSLRSAVSGSHWIAANFLGYPPENAGQCWQISSTIREIRPYLPRVDDRQVLAGARTTDIEQVALSFLDDPPGVISIRTGERLVQRYVRGILADRGYSRIRGPWRRALGRERGFGDRHRAAEAWNARRCRRYRSLLRAAGRFFCRCPGGLGRNRRALAQRTAARAARAGCPGAALRRSGHRRHQRLGGPHSLLGPVPGISLRARRGLARAILRQSRSSDRDGPNRQQKHRQERKDCRYRTGSVVLDLAAHALTARSKTLVQIRPRGA